MNTDGKKELCIAIDYYDLIDVYKELFAEEHIDRLLGEYASRGVTAVQWRVSVLGRLLYRSKLGDMYTNEPFSADNIPGLANTNAHVPLVKAAETRGDAEPLEISSMKKTFYKVKAILDKIDPLEVAVRLCRKHGIKIYPWLTIYDDAGFHPLTWSNLIRKHPEYCWKSYKGNQYYHGITSYVYPEVVDYRLAQIKEMLSYNPDGIHLCTRSHSRPPGYNEEFMRFLMNHEFCEWRATPSGKKMSELIDAAKKHFGFDPPAVEAFEKKTGRKPSPDDEEWWKFRGAYLTDFLRKAKKLISGNNAELSFGPRYDFNIYPENFFDWSAMLNEKIADQLHYGATDNYCGKESIGREWPEFLNSPGRKNYFFCVKSNQNSSDFIRTFEATGNAEFLNKFNGLTIFEAFHLSMNPELWNFVDYLRNIASSK